MDTSGLKKFAQAARQELLEQVSSKLDFVLADESVSRREVPSIMAELEKALSAQGRDALIDQVAYTWFNRFCALRFMDVNQYNRVGVVTPADGQSQPEILAEAKSGVFDEDQVNPSVIEKVRGLLNGSILSPDGQGEAYRLLIVASCNALNARMPYLFERIQDFTELLMPDDLLSDNSILAKMRAAMTPEACKDVEVIGWLYQFYISEKKDEVFAGLKKNQKITAENIPAATQLFTPHWIVQYLVENSLGRLWMLNRPNSKLTDQMEYFIGPEEPETDFLRVSSPEEIKICDPAAGSGHMLTYAFDLLYAIYEEEGYDPNDIPGLILSNNLYGIEIDERAGALASFALEMKAAAKLGRRRFFRMDAKPNVCVLEDVAFTDSELNDVLSIVGEDLYSADLRETLTQFEQAKNFGSLITPQLKDPAETLQLVDRNNLEGDIWLTEVHARLEKVLRMAQSLAAKYHVVVANPPYMEIGGANEPLKLWAMDNYSDSSSNLFAMFMERGLSLSEAQGMLGMINMQAWMFLSSFNKLRDKILSKFSILSMVHLGENAFDSIGGEVVSTTSFVIKKHYMPNYKGEYLRLVSGKSEAEKAELFNRAKEHKEADMFFRSEPKGFSMITGSPISYWASNQLRRVFKDSQTLKTVANPRKGMVTADNPRFIRGWWEVTFRKIGLDLQSRVIAKSSGCKWFPYLKGGPFRRWYGNLDHIVNWENDGFELLNMKGNGYKVGSTNHNLDYIFRPALTWTKITTGPVSFRSSNHGFLFDDASGLCPLRDPKNQNVVAALLNSPVVCAALGALNPTLNINPGNLADLPVVLLSESGAFANECIKLSKRDWDSYETSWGFIQSPLMHQGAPETTFKDTFQKLRSDWGDAVSQLKALEEENNRIFINAYGLQDELSPEVPIEEITLTCNPAYRYGIKGTEEEREARLKADTMAEFLSYAVGCMFGRYSLDEPDLILANQGETLANYLARIPEPTFMPDDDNVIPMIDFEGDWFEDDISERFKQFLRVTFGDEHFAENLAFIEDSLGKSIQKYFVKDFYNDHVQRYKKRPIYWLFSSPKGTFNALIYMHRYTPSTASVVLNEYLREFRIKLEARRDSQEQITINTSSSAREKSAALKMIQKLDKALDEVNTYEREVLYPLAGQNIEIDLDDGVKHNYPLFGKALKKVPGLS